MLLNTPLGGIMTFVVSVFFALVVAGLILLVAGSSAWALVAAPVALLASVGAMQWR